MYCSICSNKFNQDYSIIHPILKIYSQNLCFNCAQKTSLNPNPSIPISDSSAVNVMKSPPSPLKILIDYESEGDAELKSDNSLEITRKPKPNLDQHQNYPSIIGYDQNDISREHESAKEVNEIELEPRERKIGKIDWKEQILYPYLAFIVMFIIFYLPFVFIVCKNPVMTATTYGDLYIRTWLLIWIIFNFSSLPLMFFLQFFTVYVLKRPGFGQKASILYVFSAAWSLYGITKVSSRPCQKRNLHTETYCIWVSAIAIIAFSLLLLIGFAIISIIQASKFLYKKLN